jgi:hypothetical protein
VNTPRSALRGRQPHGLRHLRTGPQGSSNELTIYLKQVGVKVKSNTIIKFQLWRDMISDVARRSNIASDSLKFSDYRGVIRAEQLGIYSFFIPQL